MRTLMLFTFGFAGYLLMYHCDLSVLTVVGAVLSGGWIHWYLHKFENMIYSVVLIILGALCGLCYNEIYTQKVYGPLEEYYGIEVAVKSEVLDFPQEGSYGKFYITVEAVLVNGEKGKAIFSGYEELGSFVPGDIFYAYVTLMPSNETYGGDATTYYTSRGIVLRGQIEGEIYKEEETGGLWKHMPVYLTNYLRQGIFDVFPEPYCGIILALVTGNRDELSEEFDTGLSLVGLSHVVAVSGMHLTFLVGMIEMVLPRHKKWTFVVTTGIVILFMFMSGSTPSIMRASVMILLLQFALLLRRGRDDMTALSAAVFLLLVWNPYVITHVGLHLSVAAVASLLLFGEKMKEGMINFCCKEKKGTYFEVMDFFCSGIATSLSAMILTVPLVGGYFGYVSLISPIANVLVLWAVTISFSWGLICGTVGIFFPVLGRILSLPIFAVMDILQWVVKALSGVKYGFVTLESDYYLIWLYFVYTTLIFYLFWKGYKSWKSIFLLSGVWICTFGVAVYFQHEEVFGEGIYVQVLDVGQGQSVMFATSDILILADCGGNSYENPGNIVSNMMGNVGRGELDYLVVSHCDMDHIGGITQLMERVFVKCLMMPPMDVEDERQVELVEMARGYGTSVVFVEEYIEKNLGNGNMMRVYPPVGVGSSNEAGIILMMSSGEEDVLVLGDIGMRTELSLLGQFEIPDIEYLFLGHHGSKFSTSPDFLDEITPEVGIICVGTNSYGHPTEEVLERLEEREIEIHRTDIMGGLIFQIG